MRCQQLEAELAIANEAAERADLERQAREERLRLAKAVDVAEHRLADLERVHQEAERVRREADWDATKQLEKARARADELLHDAELRATKVRPSVLKRSAALRQLKETALLMTERRLPELAKQLTVAGPQELQVHPFVQAVGLQGHDDIGQAARALETAYRACVGLAVDQALLRRRSAAVFSNLARRCQVKVHRQLSRLSEMESAEANPQRLTELFELDHLATSMRRICENLLAFAGTDPVRRWTRPVPLVDVLRAAASEVEDYERIELASVPACSVAGPVVNDCVHLLAELLENALTFSPPQTKVKVKGLVLPDGRVLIEIQDQGIGMSAEEFADVNERLAGPPSANGLDGSRVGLTVVGLLGARQTIRMQLRASDDGGVTALVMLPASASVPPGSTTVPHRDLAVTTAGLFGNEPSIHDQLSRQPQHHPEPDLHLFTICDSGGLFIERDV